SKNPYSCLNGNFMTFIKATSAESPIDMGPFSLPTCLCLHGFCLSSSGSRPVQFGFNLLWPRHWVSGSFFRMDDTQPSFTLTLGQGTSLMPSF
ncbi:mCG1041701, partial [Mus musculus]